MTSSIDPSRITDVARETLCHQLSALMQAGANHVRVRLHRKGTDADQAWFYAHQENHWKKEGPGVTQADLVLAMEKDLEMIASRGKSEELTVRKAAAADWTDYDLQFRAGLLHERQGASLESSVYGVLFRDSHASGKDVRHHARTPHHGA